MSALGDIRRDLIALQSRVAAEESSLADFRGGTVGNKSYGPVIAEPATLVRKWQNEWPSGSSRSVIAASITAISNAITANTAVLGSDATALSAAVTSLNTRVAVLDAATTS